MKKRVLLGVFLGAIVIGCFVTLHYGNDYTPVIKANWGIELPGRYQVEYFSQDDGSIFGDGYRYYVLSCSEADMKKLAAGDAFDEMTEEKEYPEVYQVCNERSVPKSQQPPANLKCWKMTGAEESMEFIYILLDKKARKVYTAELFI